MAAKKKRPRRVRESGPATGGRGKRFTDRNLRYMDVIPPDKRPKGKTSA
jgi:hypothetical protein